MLAAMRDYDEIVSGLSMRLGWSLLLASPRGLGNTDRRKYQPPIGVVVIRDCHSLPPIKGRGVVEAAALRTTAVAPSPNSFVVEKEQSQPHLYMQLRPHLRLKPPGMSRRAIATSTCAKRRTPRMPGLLPLLVVGA